MNYVASARCSAIFVAMVTIADIATTIAVERAAALPGREAVSVSSVMWQLWEVHP